MTNRSDDVARPPWGTLRSSFGPSSLILISGFILLVSALAGCHSTPPPPPAVPTSGLVDPTPLETVHAIVSPPTGWEPDPLKESDNHTHQVWSSPSDHTAYGVIHFSLPLPFSAEFVLPTFLAKMKEDQGEAILLEKYYDPTLPGVRFIAEGGLYKIRGNLITKGFQGWSIYAGTLRAEPINEAELKLAEKARENTRIAP
jgi:hypothetical protein